MREYEDDEPETPDNVSFDTQPPWTCRSIPGIASATGLGGPHGLKPSLSRWCSLALEPGAQGAHRLQLRPVPPPVHPAYSGGERQQRTEQPAPFSPIRPLSLLIQKKKVYRLKA